MSDPEPARRGARFACATHPPKNGAYHVQHPQQRHAPCQGLGRIAAGPGRGPTISERAGKIREQATDYARENPKTAIAAGAALAAGVIAAAAIPLVRGRSGSGGGAKKSGGGAKKSTAKKS